MASTLVVYGYISIDLWIIIKYIYLSSYYFLFVIWPHAILIYVLTDNDIIMFDTFCLKTLHISINILKTVFIDLQKCWLFMLIFTPPLSVSVLRTLVCLPWTVQTKLVRSSGPRLTWHRGGTYRMVNCPIFDEKWFT